MPSRSLPDPESVRAIEPTYNLAVVLAGSLEDRKQLLLSYLPKVAQWLGPGEIWDRLITPEEWSAFPSDALQALVLLDTSSMPPGAQGFQGTVEEILAQKKGWSIDERLDEWWDGADLGKVRKLMDLLDRKLVSNAAAAARMCKLPARRLADLAADKRVFTFLADEVRKGGVASDWAGELFARTEEAGSIEMARRFLAIPDFLFPKTWRRSAAPGVLQPVHIRHPDLPRDLAPLLFAAGKDLRPTADPGLYLLRTEVFGVTQSPGSENGFAKRLLTELPRTIQEDDFPRFFRILDRLMLERLEETTRALIESGWWYAWRQEPKLDHAQLQAAAMAWITCDAWTKGREAHLEAWKKVVCDLPPNLEAKFLERRWWPWIPPFEEDQIGDLAQKAADLGALAVLAETIRNEPFFQGREAHVLVLKYSEFAGTFDKPSILSWLMSRDPWSLPALDLAQSALLYENAGQRQPQALAARRRSVEEALGSYALSALRGADSPDLWTNPDFVTSVADWMRRRGSLAEIGRRCRFPDRFESGLQAVSASAGSRPASFKSCWTRVTETRQVSSRGFMWRRARRQPGILSSKL